jgi:hypothetical protein
MKKEMAVVMGILFVGAIVVGLTGIMVDIFMADSMAASGLMDRALWLVQVQSLSTMSVLRSGGATSTILGKSAVDGRDGTSYRSNRPSGLVGYQLVCIHLVPVIQPNFRPAGSQQ